MLDATGELLPFHASLDISNYVAWAGGFVARGRQLLSGMTTLVEHGDDDAVGVLYRTLLETFMSGLYALLGRDDALHALHRALLFRTHELEVALGLKEPQKPPADAEPLRLSDFKSQDGLVERVDGLLAEQNDAYTGWAPDIHRNHYRVLSHHDAHGGIGSLKGYIDVDTDTGTTTVVPVADSTRKAVFLLHHAIIHVGGFAALWAREARLDASSVSAALERWEEAQPEVWNPEADQS
jgi:hypothetical protein